MRTMKRLLGALIILAGAMWAFGAAASAVTGTIEERLAPFTGAMDEQEPKNPLQPYVKAVDNYTAFMATSSWGLRGLQRGLGQPEQRQGQIAPQPVVTYTALGDSLSTGLMAARGYVDRHHAYLATASSTQVGLTNLGVTGMTSSQLLEVLREDDHYRQAVQAADVLTWNIGGNDFLQARARYKSGMCDEKACLDSAVAEFSANWEAIVDELQVLLPPHATVRTMNAYYPFVAQDKADGSFDRFKPYMDALNSHMCAIAERHEITCADVYSAFHGTAGIDDPQERGYLTLDGIHPTDKGHRVIARLLRELERE